MAQNGSIRILVVITLVATLFVAGCSKVDAREDSRLIHELFNPLDFTVSSIEKISRQEARDLYVNNLTITEDLLEPRLRYLEEIGSDTESGKFKDLQYYRVVLTYVSDGATLSRTEAVAVCTDAETGIRSALW